MLLEDSKKLQKFKREQEEKMIDRSEEQIYKDRFNKRVEAFKKAEEAEESEEPKRGPGRPRKDEKK